MVDFESYSPSDWLLLADRFYARLYEVCESLSPEQWERRTPYLGWTARQVLAHESTAVPINFRGMLDRALAGNPAQPPQFNTFLRNRRAVFERRSTPAHQLLADFRSHMGGFLDTYRKLTSAEWKNPAWFYVGTIDVRSVFLALIGDNMLHMRDLMLTQGKWRGFDPELTPPLIDWYVRALRPASLHPEHALGLDARVLHRLTGVGAGEWTMHIRDGRCTVEQGAVPHPDVVIEADTEALLAAGQGRAAPFVGGIARRLEWVRGPDHCEDVVAGITGLVSLGAARLTGRIRISGDSKIAGKVTGAFWHFWQRTEQAEYNISKGSRPDSVSPSSVAVAGGD